MIVCICNVLRESECKAAACDPACRTVGCVYRQLGCKVRCGKCVPTMAALFHTARAAALAAEAAPADAPAGPRTGGLGRGGAAC